MKLKTLALTALLTICIAAPAEAEIIIDFRGSDDRGLNGSGIIVVPSRRRHWDDNPYYRYDWDRPRYRNHRPHYRQGRFYHPHYGDYYPRYRQGRNYYPRRNRFQLRIGF